MNLRIACITILLFSAACSAAPTRDEALSAIRQAEPAANGGSVVVNVWRDGPAYFSCAEVFAKTSGRGRRAAVPGSVENWPSILRANLMIFRDSTVLQVTEPGWCVGHPADTASLLAKGWTSIDGPETPMGMKRRGWSVPAGKRQLLIARKPRHVNGDSASVDYALTVAANENGIALGADRDTVRRQALLLRDGSGWRVLDLNWRR